MHAAIRKHIFYATLLALLFMGALASVFRSDFEAKVVTCVCVAILTLISSIYYVRNHKQLL